MKLTHISATLLGGLAIVASTAALARVDVGVGINLGVPAPVYVAPAPVYVAPPAPVYYPPAPVVVAPPPGLVIGWYGDRYWDGRRYWGREEWHRHHGGPGPGHGHWDHRGGHHH